MDDSIPQFTKIGVWLPWWLLLVIAIAILVPALCWVFRMRYLPLRIYAALVSWFLLSNSMRTASAIRAAVRPSEDGGWEFDSEAVGELLATDWYSFAALLSVGVFACAYALLESRSQAKLLDLIQGNVSINQVLEVIISKCPTHWYLRRIFRNIFWCKCSFNRACWGMGPFVTWIFGKTTIETATREFNEHLQSELEFLCSQRLDNLSLRLREVGMQIDNSMTMSIHAQIKQLKLRRGLSSDRIAPNERA